MTKLLVVVGATGGQGGSVIKSFLNNRGWRLRGTTRNPDSLASRRLVDQGVEMVSADLNDAKSIQAAFVGASAIFTVTNYQEHFPARSAEECMDIDYNQGVNMAIAAAQVPTLEHYIWSTLPDSAKISGDEHFIPHFCGKAKVDQYIKKELSGLYARTTFLLVTLYGDNFQFSVVTPRLLKSTGKYVHLVPWSPDCPITLIGSHKDNVGVIVKSIFDRGAGELGTKHVVGDVEYMTAGRMLEIWSEVTGRPSAFVQILWDDYIKLWPVIGLEMALQYRWWEHEGRNPWVEDGVELVTVKQLGLKETDFVLTKDAMLAQDWDQLC